VQGFWGNLPLFRSLFSFYIAQLYLKYNGLYSFKEALIGNPEAKHISTSHVERQNLTMRMSMGRFTRLTNAHSKKIENYIHAISLHFMYYDFCKIHQLLRAIGTQEG
jgi:glutaminase